MTAVEKDTTFARELERLQNGRLIVIEGDILELPPEHFGPCKVVGNLPYSITTPILETICKGSFLSFTFMVQKELADRLLAPPGSRECGSISVFVQSQATVQGSFAVSRSCFYPSPKVDSTVISLELHPVKPPLQFFTLVRTAFQQRRKMLSSSLKTLFSPSLIKEALTLLGLPRTDRAETLPQWRGGDLILSINKKNIIFIK